MRFRKKQKQSLEHERLDKLYPPRSKGIGRGLVVIVVIAGAWFFADQAKRDYINRAHVTAGQARAYSVRTVVEQY